jgi:transcriptional regulator of acetoin/glycerol metabolism
VPAFPPSPACRWPRSEPAEGLRGHSAARGDLSDLQALLRALAATSWNVARTAQALEVSRMTLYRWLHKHGIERWQQS